MGNYIHMLHLGPDLYIANPMVWVVWPHCVVTVPKLWLPTAETEPLKDQDNLFLTLDLLYRVDKMPFFSSSLNVYCVALTFDIIRLILSLAILIRSEVGVEQYSRLRGVVSIQPALVTVK